MGWFTKKKEEVSTAFTSDLDKELTTHKAAIISIYQSYPTSSLSQHHGVGFTTEDVDIAINKIQSTIRSKYANPEQLLVAVEVTEQVRSALHAKAKNQ